MHRHRTGCAAGLLFCHWAIAVWGRCAVLQLSPDFRELRGVGASDLLYVKEDIILPHSQSFYDLIVNQVT